MTLDPLSLNRLDNFFQVTALTEAEECFLQENSVPEHLIDLYIRLRHEVMVFGNFSIFTLEDHVSFKRPYWSYNKALHKREEKMGTVVKAVFRQDSITLYFNTLHHDLKDPGNILKKSSDEMCDYSVNIGDENSEKIPFLRDVIAQAIFYTGHVRGMVRIDGKFVTVGER